MQRNLHVGLPEKEVDVAEDWKSAEENHPHDHAEIFNSVPFDTSIQPPSAQGAVEAANNDFEHKLALRKAKSKELEACE